jgi:hypothetical protein
MVTVLGFYLNFEWLLSPTTQIFPPPTTFYQAQRIFVTVASLQKKKKKNWSIFCQLYSLFKIRYFLH